MKKIIWILVISSFLSNCKESTEPEKETTINYALLFNGMDSFVELHPSVLTNMPSGSVELWINVYDFGRTFFYKETYDSSTISGMRINYDGRIQTSHENFSSANDVISQKILKKNLWYHIAWTWNGTDQNIYINGYLDNSQPCQDGVADRFGEWLRLGRGDDYFNGEIDDLRVWNKARTQAEISTNMNKELTGQEQGLIGCWCFNEGEGEIAYDKSANQYHGMLNGGVSWEVH